MPHIYKPNSSVTYLFGFLVYFFIFVLKIIKNSLIKKNISLRIEGILGRNVFTKISTRAFSDEDVPVGG